MLTKQQIATASAEAQIAFCLGKYNSFEEALARAIEDLVRAECVPPGFVVVPVEPTQEMVSAFHSAIRNWLKEEGDDAAIWDAMLATAPGATPKEPSNG